MRRGRRDRPLKPEETALWRAVTEKVTPLSPVPDPASGPEKSDASRTKAGAPQAGPPASMRTKPAQRPPLPGAPRPLPHRHATPPPGPPGKLEAGDSRLARNVARGRRDIDAVLDLHGFTQDEAFVRLRRFVELGAASGARTLLIVTGKGAGERPAPFAEAPRGVLRRRFLDWIEVEPFKGRIAAVRPAHRRHGGGGAFYVFLKRPTGKR